MHEAIEGRLINGQARIASRHRRGKSVIAAMALAMAAAGAPTAISAASGPLRAPARSRAHVTQPIADRDLATLQAAQAKRDRKAAKRAKERRAA